MKMATTEQALAGFASGEGLGTTISKVRSSIARFSRNDSQDIVQEALTRAVAHEVEGNLEPWLRTVSRRIAIDNARRAREYAVGSADEVDRVGLDRASSPEDVVMNNEGMSMIRRAMRSLPVRYRDALLAYSRDGDNGAVAARFGLSSNATCSLLSRARARLREELNRVGYAFGGVALKLNRWHREVATAAAGACLAIVVAGAGANAAPAVAARPAPATAVTRATVAVTRNAQAPATPGVGRAVVRVVPKVVHEVVKRTEVIRYQVTACGPRGKSLIAPYVTVVKDGHPSLVGTVATKLPHLPVVQAGPCR